MPGARTAMMRPLAVAAALLSLGRPAAGEVRYVSVGPELSWRGAESSSRYVSVTGEGIWMWDVEPNANLSATLGERGGRVLYSDPERGLTPLPGGEALFDGDPTTFFDPDLQEGVVRSSTLWIDLGATFRINRVRFHPRLDFGNRNRFLQEFTLSAAQFLDPLADSRGVMFFKAPNENTSPVVDKRFRSVEARVLALEPQVDRAWEIAELEVYSDGTLPVGEFESQPLRAGRPEPVWGRVLYEGGDVSTAPVVVRTRTGPDRSPLLYYLIQGGDVVQYSKAGWENAPPEDRGPVELNPAWSPWEPVTDGLVRSPPLNRYLQFHVTLTEPGAGLRELRFEYVYPPVARDLAAEISPLEARAGMETPFTLSLQVHLDRTGSESHRDTGFRQLQVRTAAEIGEVTRIRVDDLEVLPFIEVEPGTGFTVNLPRRVVQDGSFLQVEFTATVFHERTRFEVQALDRRTEEGESRVAYQVARPADIDGEPGGGLVVRHGAAEGGLSLISNLRAASPVTTPNADGVNDRLELTFTLLKLMEPARLTLDIFAVDGRPLVRAWEADHGAGTLTAAWDGLDGSGRPVPPGLYLYELRVHADGGTGRRRGVVELAY